MIIANKRLNCMFKHLFSKVVSWQILNCESTSRYIQQWENASSLQNFSKSRWKLFYKYHPDLHLYFRLYSDEEYLVRAASRLGLGQELLDGDMVDNLSRGLQTAAGAYKFLSELHWTVKLSQLSQ